MEIIEHGCRLVSHNNSWYSYGLPDAGNHQGRL